MDAAVKIPLSQRINLRLVAFLGVMLVLIGYPIYVLVDNQVTGGIKDAGGGYKQVDLKAMSTFAFDQTNGTIDDIPKKWRDLDGQRVVVYGEMWSTMGAGPNVDSFDLVYSIAKCCVTSAPQIQHFVHSRPMRGAQVEYSNGLVKAKGILHVNVTRDPEQNKVSGVYHLDIESVEPANGY